MTNPDAARRRPAHVRRTYGHDARVAIAFRLTPTEAAALTAWAEAQGLTRSAVIRDALAPYLAHPVEVTRGEPLPYA